MKQIRKFIYKNIEVLIFLILSICLAMYIGYRYMEKFENDDKPYGINEMNGIVYINLENRGDRKEQILKELQGLNTDMNKVNKISGIYIPKNGHKGCVQAHILALNLAKLNNWEKTLILEDDALIKDSSTDFNNILHIALDKLKDKQWDVLMVAGNNKIFDDKSDPIKISYESIPKLTPETTTTNDNKKDITKEIKTLEIKKLKSCTSSYAYIIKLNYIDKLLEVFNTSNNNMNHNKLSGNNYEYWALDQQWSKLQGKDNWYAFNEDPITHSAIWSTIMKESHQ